MVGQTKLTVRARVYAPHHSRPHPKHPALPAFATPLLLPLPPCIPCLCYLAPPAFAILVTPFSLLLASRQPVRSQGHPCPPVNLIVAQCRPQRGWEQSRSLC